MTIQLPLKISETLWLSKSSVTKAWSVFNGLLNVKLKIYSEPLSDVFVKFYTHKFFTQ